MAPRDAGELAQLGERLVCNQEVTGSSPVFSTNLRSPAHGEASFGWQASRLVHRSAEREGGLASHAKVAGEPRVSLKLDAVRSVQPIFDN